MSVQRPVHLAAFWLADYEREHSRCPQCGSGSIEATTAGYLPLPGVAYVDQNRARCDCGWQGIVHDLKPESENT